MFWVYSFLSIINFLLNSSLNLLFWEKRLEPTGVSLFPASDLIQLSLLQLCCAEICVHTQEADTGETNSFNYSFPDAWVSFENNTFFICDSCPWVLLPATLSSYMNCDPFQFSTSLTLIPHFKMEALATLTSVACWHWRNQYSKISYIS